MRCEMRCTMYSDTLTSEITENQHMNAIFTFNVMSEICPAVESEGNNSSDLLTNHYTLK